ncbi:MAG: AMP-binding protein, partial [Planctomycetota bacterium]
RAVSLPILAAAQRHAEHLAFDDGQQQIRYGDLESTIVGKLTAFSFPTGKHVAWCPGNDQTAFLAFWKILSEGGVACPISHRFPEAKRKAVVHSLDAIWLPELELGSDREEFGADPKISLKVRDDAVEKPATIILSSGSTGTPKAIVHSMAAHIANAQGSAENMPLRPGDRWLWSLPLCHVSGLAILIRCAVASATVVGMRNGERITANLLKEKKVTHLSVVATQLQRLLKEKGFPSPSLKFVLLGGSSITPDLVHEARERGVAVITSYGLTEMGSQVTASTANGTPDRSGRVLPRRELKIDPSGEICVRGEPLCLGYFREGLIHPVVDKNGWFPTGDLGSMDRSGELSVKGRLDNMFISGGENIHPENIERVMVEVFGLSQVVIVPKPDETFGARPVAFVDGDLPSDWGSMLKPLLSSYEIPIEVRPWPAEASLAIKPDRKLLASLA